MNYKIKTVFDLYKYSVYKYYDKLLFRTKYESVSYKNLDILINKYKFIMKEYGIKKGESIVYIGNNSIECNLNVGCIGNVYLNITEANDTLIGSVYYNNINWTVTRLA